MKFSKLPEFVQKAACDLLVSEYTYNRNTKSGNEIALDIASVFCELFEYEKPIPSVTANPEPEKPTIGEFRNMFVGCDPAKEKDSTVFIKRHYVNGAHAGYILYSGCDCPKCKREAEKEFKYSLDQSVITMDGVGYGKVVSRNKSVYGEIYAVNIESGAMKGKTLYFEESTLYGVP
ncbi:hypothetical protein JEQ07_18760 [Serratia proteamaculans]|uniref:Uncharacterized protein n=1 Tax=Serratia proteamaculans TaxID=28151 RepID=A0ABS0TVN3_SERPR|nr:hypothetical protein [Serratia proteamaculans]MBI6182421.1 hypothetical protein [Serratia proteamaculans]